MTIRLLAACYIFLGGGASIHALGIKTIISAGFNIPDAVIVFMIALSFSPPYVRFQGPVTLTVFHISPGGPILPLSSFHL
jgi:hypothetical protein